LALDLRLQQTMEMLLPRFCSRGKTYKHLWCQRSAHVIAHLFKMLLLAGYCRLQVYDSSGIRYCEMVQCFMQLQSALWNALE